MFIGVGSFLMAETASDENHVRLEDIYQVGKPTIMTLDHIGGELQHLMRKYYDLRSQLHEVQRFAREFRQAENVKKALDAASEGIGIEDDDFTRQLYDFMHRRMGIIANADNLHELYIIGEDIHVIDVLKQFDTVQGFQLGKTMLAYDELHQSFQRIQCKAQHLLDEQYVDRMFDMLRDVEPFQEHKQVLNHTHKMVMTMLRIIVNAQHIGQVDKAAQDREIQKLMSQLDQMEDVFPLDRVVEPSVKHLAESITYHDAQDA